MKPRLLATLCFLVSTLCLLGGYASADPADVGRLFSSPNPDQLKTLKLTEEAVSLYDVDNPRLAEALIYRTLGLCPLHPQAFDAVDLLVSHVTRDRSVPDQDRADAVRSACSLGVRTAQSWVDFYKTGDNAARAELKRIEYLFRSMQGADDAGVRYVQELSKFFDAFKDSSYVGQAVLRLSEYYVETGQFQRVIDLNQQVAERHAHVPANLLGRSYWEVGNFVEAIRVSGPDGWSGGRAAMREPRDAVARMRLYLGDISGAINLISGGALVRHSDVFVHIERGWLEMPAFRKFNRDFQLPVAAVWSVDLNWQVQTSYVADSPDFIDGKPVTTTLDMTLNVNPVFVPKGKTQCSVSITTPVEIETPVPYAATALDADGFRSAWPFDLVPTPDDYVNAPRIWARSCDGVLRNPPVRVWRTCKVLDNNRVQVDVYLSASTECNVVINNSSLIDDSVVFPDSVDVGGKRTIRMKYAPTGPVESRRPATPFCSYILRRDHVKTYLPAVTVIPRVTLPEDTDTAPSSASWRWDVAGHVLQISSPSKFSVRNLAVSLNCRYQLTELLEPAP